MLAGAVEDAILDGADVINNSWGSTPLSKDSNDPLVRAYEAAVDAGVVVVFSNGNSGPGYNTSGSPGAESTKFIAVGASTTDRAYYNTVKVTEPTPVTDTLKTFLVTSSLILLLQRSLLQPLDHYLIFLQTCWVFLSLIRNLTLLRDGSL